VSIQLTFEAEPTVDTLITLCFGDSVQIQGNWYDQDTSFSYLGQLPGISCDVRFEVEIQIQPNWNVTHTVEEPCPSSADGSIQFSLGSRTLSELRRVELDGIDSLQLQWNNLAAGDYTLMMEDTVGCVYSESITLTGGAPIDITVPEVAISCEGEAVQLSAQYISGDSTGLSLNWADGGTGPNLTVTQPGDYVLRVMTDCEDFEVTGRVRVDGADGGIRMFVPNVFSPNRDGINDVFQPTFSKPGAIETYRLQIFDRWGNLMFESQDPAVGWDGQSNDKVLNPGVYVWRIEWQSSACAGSTIVEESGSISLLR
jgi:gliding motility-associated-like protein